MPAPDADVTVLAVVLFGLLVIGAALWMGHSGGSYLLVSVAGMSACWTTARWRTLAMTSRIAGVLLTVAMGPIILGMQI
jgi:hypothetical protein